MSEANRDDGRECLARAQRAKAEGDFAKAKRLAEKANNLYPSPQTEAFLRSMQGGTSSSFEAGPSQPRARASTATSADQRSNGAAASTSAASAGTPQQREMVRTIRACKGDYYKVLGVERGATDDELKKAYRKFALKLHPDKCQVAGGDEAFKEVSKAFQCLTDPQKRAYYDRTGHEDLQSHSAAQAQRRSRGPRQAGYGPELDPQDLFNMMFGGGGFGMGPMHFGGFRGMQQQQQQRQHAHGARDAGQHPFAASGVLQLVVLLALLAFGIFSQRAPPFTLQPDSQHRERIHTRHRDVPFWVASSGQFESRYPAHTQGRMRFERQVEQALQQDLVHRCNQETMVELHRNRWSRQFHAMPKPACAKHEELFGPVHNNF